MGREQPNCLIQHSFMNNLAVRAAFVVSRTSRGKEIKEPLTVWICSPFYYPARFLESRAGFQQIHATPRPGGPSLPRPEPNNFAPAKALLRGQARAADILLLMERLLICSRRFRRNVDRANLPPLCVCVLNSAVSH